VGSRPPQPGGKAAAFEEETSTGTRGSTGVGVEASGERFAELTSGRSLLQQGLTATCEDLRLKAYQPRRREEEGLAHEFVVARTAA
jgi:hypothetical protein